MKQWLITIHRRRELAVPIHQLLELGHDNYMFGPTIDGTIKYIYTSCDV